MKRIEVSVRLVLGPLISGLGGLAQVNAGLLLGALMLGGAPAHAVLTSYTANGINLVYDQDRNLTWMGDANLFKTQYDVDSAVVTTIINLVQLHRQ